MRIGDTDCPRYWSGNLASRLYRRRPQALAGDIYVHMLDCALELPAVHILPDGDGDPAQNAVQFRTDNPTNTILDMYWVPVEG